MWLFLVLTSLSLLDWSRLPLRWIWPSGRPAVLCLWLEQASWETDQTLELVVVGGPIYHECRCRYRPRGWWESGRVGEMLCLLGHPRGCPSWCGYWGECLTHTHVSSRPPGRQAGLWVEGTGMPTCHGCRSRCRQFYNEKQSTLENWKLCPSEQPQRTHLWSIAVGFPVYSDLGGSRAVVPAAMTLPGCLLWYLQFSEVFRWHLWLRRVFTSSE